MAAYQSDRYRCLAMLVSSYWVPWLLTFDWHTGKHRAHLPPN
jgi:hypothetical protein